MKEGEIMKSLCRLWVISIPALTGDATVTNSELPDTIFVG